MTIEIPLSLQYLELRNAAFENSETIYDASKHPCNGCREPFCCVPEVQTTPFDEALIFRAFKDKELTGGLRRKVLKNAKRLPTDEDRIFPTTGQPMCPFLLPSRDDPASLNCSIYPYRPLVCVRTGGAGWPREDAPEFFKTDPARRKQWHFNELTSTMPAQCHDAMEQADFYARGGAVQADLSMQAWMYQHPGTHVTNFVLNHLDRMNKSPYFNNAESLIPLDLEAYVG
ncbi:hypothetical protein GF362_05480 [Candidatus Dojkabacteria bacterium]|nr:hypothetical protein [Candidatus Dojkabacteria bacterium]